MRATALHDGTPATEQVCDVCGGDQWSAVALLIHDVSTGGETRATGYRCTACGGMIGNVLPLNEGCDPHARRTPK